MATRNTTKKPAIPVPQTRDELEEFAAEITKAQQAVEAIQLSSGKRVAQLQEAAAKAVRPHQALIDERFEGVYAYAESHRAELTDGDRVKTVPLRNGSVLVWRTTPPKVNLTKIDNVLKALRQMKLTRFIRTKPEINKEAMLAEPEVAKTVPGVTITQHEEFSLKPPATPELTKKLGATAVPKAA